MSDLRRLKTRSEIEDRVRALRADILSDILLHNDLSKQNCLSTGCINVRKRITRKHGQVNILIWVLGGDEFNKSE